MCSLGLGLHTHAYVYVGMYTHFTFTCPCVFSELSHHCPEAGVPLRRLRNRKARAVDSLLCVHLLVDRDANHLVTFLVLTTLELQMVQSRADLHTGSKLGSMN